MSARVPGLGQSTQRLVGLALKHGIAYPRIEVETTAMTVRVPTITCPYCRFTFVNVRVTKHGLIRCGNCGKTMKI